MKQIVILSILLLLSGCALHPKLDAGKALVETFYSANFSLSVYVHKIVNAKTGKTVFDKKIDDKFGSISFQVDEGTYFITYACDIERTKNSSMKYHHYSTPKLTDKYQVNSGQIFRLRYKFVNNIQYGKHCEPLFK